MLNRRAVLFGIFCVLFVAAAFGQDQSDPNIITVTKKIDVAKLDENVEELNRNVKALTDTLEKLNKNVETLTTTVGDLEKTVTKLEERTLGTAKTVHVILASFIGPLVVAILAAIIISLINRNRNSEGRAAATNTTQVNQNEAASTNLAQENEGKAASTATASSRFPEGEKLKEYLKSDSFVTREKV